MLKNPFVSVIIYIALVISYTVAFAWENNWQLVFIDSSGLGDFLSGLFAPLAFLYLFLGHKQQEKALQKTNQDLLSQLKIQKEMLDLQKADLKARKHAVKPIIEPFFELQDLPCESKITGKSDSSFRRILIIELSNSGEKVSRVNVECISPFRKIMTFNQVLDNNGTLKSKLFINESKLHDYNEDEFVNLEIQLNFTTKLGVKYKTIYEVQLSMWPENDYLTHGGLVYEMECED